MKYMSLFPKYGSSSFNSKSCTKARSMTLAVTSYPDIQKADHIQWPCPVTERSIDWVNTWTKAPAFQATTFTPSPFHPSSIPLPHECSFKKNLQNITISLLFTWLTFIYHSKLNFFAPPWGLQNLDCHSLLAQRHCPSDPNFCSTSWFPVPVTLTPASASWWSHLHPYKESPPSFHLIVWVPPISNNFSTVASPVFPDLSHFSRGPEGIK